MLKDKVYDFLKWFAIVAVTPIITFCETVLPVWGVGESVVHTITVTLGGIGTLLAAILVKSNYSYKKNGEAKIDEEDME